MNALVPSWPPRSRVRVSGFHELINGVINGIGAAAEGRQVPPVGEPIEQHCGRKDERARVGLVLALDIRRRAVLRLRHAVCIAGVDRAAQAEAAGKLRSKV